MLLGSDQILASVTQGILGISPFARENLKPNSYVVHLSENWGQWRPAGNPLDPLDPGCASEFENFRAPRFQLDPQCFVLGMTIERVAMPSNIAALLLPMSHIARLGLVVNLGSALVSASFGSKVATALTLEIVNLQSRPIILTHGLPICHLAFIHVDSREWLEGALARSVYEGLQSPVASMLSSEFPKHVEVKPDNSQPNNCE